MLGRQRLITTFRDGKAYPFVLKINSKHIELAAGLIHLFQDAIGRRRFEIDDRIKAFNIEKVNPKVIQGLSDLLYKRSSFDDLSSANAQEMRWQIFSTSADYWKSVSDDRTGFLQHRKNILKATSLSETIEEEQLFGDIPANQKLDDFDTIPAEQLLHRFNIAQVQGLLLDARSLELRIHRSHDAAFKQLMQMMKFFRLMFDLKEIENKWLTLAIDGPGAVLDHSRSYGIEIAQFFPAILLLNVPWQMTACLKIPNRRRLFSLEITENNPYQSHYQARNVWTHEKATLLINRFNEKYPQTHRAFSEREIIPLQDNRFLLPDFTIEKIDIEKDGVKKRCMRFEWIHYQSETKLKWLRKVKPNLPDNYVFALKGNREKMKALSKAMGKHLLIYMNDLTAPAIMKKFEEDTP